MNRNDKETISYDEARKEIEVTSRRIALLHLAYAETLIEELGEEKGKKLIADSIKSYGIKIGQRVKEEVQQMNLELTPENFKKGRYYGLPSFGMHDSSEKIIKNEEERTKYYGCVLGKTWRELKQDKLGRMYCYVDAAKYMAYNQDYKMIHYKAMTDGDDFCELCVKKTNENEKNDFANDDKDWFYIDR